MFRSSVLLKASVILAALLAPALATPGSGATRPFYELHLVCPGQGNDYSFLLDCPIRIKDSDDILGNPSVAVDGKRPTNIIIASLHGADANGPSNRSRGPTPLGGMQLLTTHISLDSGQEWTDQPWLPPEPVRDPDTRGEHVQTLVDNAGRLYVGALYSYGEDEARTFSIFGQKYNNIGHLDNVGSGAGGAARKGDHNFYEIEPIHPGGQITQFWMLFDNATQTVTYVWHEHPPRDALPQFTADASGLLGAVAGGPPLPSVDPKVRSVVGAVWTDTVYDGEYTHFHESELIGPCRSTTNPVLAAGFIYIGCIVDPTAGNYVWDADAVAGQVDLFRFAPRGGAPPEYLGTVPIDPGGRPMLGVRSDNRVVVLNALIDGGQLRVQAVYGLGSSLRDMQWSKPFTYSNEIGALVVGKRILSVGIQDLVYREPSGVVHFIIKFRFEPTLPVPSGQGLPVPVPVPPGPTSLRTSYAKFLVAADEDYGVLKTFSLDIGNPVNRSNFATVQPANQDPREQDDVFDDLTDDLYQIPPKKGMKFNGKDLGDDYQREFFAVADYGDLIYAEVVEVTDLRYAPFGVPTVPIVIPSASLSLTGIATGVAGTALVGLFALRAALRRSTVAAAAKQK